MRVIPPISQGLRPPVLGLVSGEPHLRHELGTGHTKAQAWGCPDQKKSYRV